MDEYKVELEEEMEIEVNPIAHKLSMTSWALFFIWMGIVLSTGLGAGYGLLGIGIIILGTQLARKLSNLSVEGFWVLVGVLLLLGAVGKLIAFGIALIPFVLILAGVVILWSVYFGRSANRDNG